MSKDIIKKPATDVSKWFAKETIGNFIYDQIGLFWRSAIMTAVVTGALRLFSGIPLDVWLIVALFIAALSVFILDRVARRRGWLTLHSPDTSSTAPGAEDGLRDAVVKAVGPSEPPKCDYEAVHRIAEHQAKHMRDFVTVSTVGVWEHKLNDPVPTIKWGFRIQNSSILPIRLVEVSNNLFFEKIELAERRFDDFNEVEYLEYGREGSVQFDQRLSGPEAQYIKNTPEGKFRFNRLVIKVGNPTSFPVIEPQELDIADELETTLDEITYKETKGMASLRKQRDELKAELDQARPPSLSFEIDGQQSQVNTTGGGTGGHRISVNVRLRCMKVADHPMAIREFHASLIKENGSEQVVVPQESVLIVMTHPDMKIIDFSNGWTIAEPLTGYRWFMFYLDITVEQLQKLALDYFIRITMIAVGQKPYTVEFDVDNWQDARRGNSNITVRQ